MKTDYAAHEARYREQKANGADGWDEEDLSALRVRELAWALSTGPMGKRVLELGCGAGNLASLLVQQGFDVTGVDVSPTAIEWARERVPAAKFVVADVTQPISGTFDWVIDSHCLHCIIGADRARVLENVFNALSVGGRFFVSTMCGEVTMPALRAYFDPVSRCQVVNGVAYRFIGAPEALLEELRAAGFDLHSSRIEPRTSDDDQDNLWAMAIRR